MSKIEISEKSLKYILSDKFLNNEKISKRDKDVLLKYINEIKIIEISKLFDLTTSQIRNIIINTLNRIEPYLRDKTPFMLIQDSALSSRTKNAIYCYNKLKCLLDFDGLNVNELLKMRNFGKSGINEIQEYIKDLGLSLKFPKEKPEKYLKFQGNFRKDMFDKLSDDEIFRLIISLTKYINERINDRYLNMPNENYKK